MTDNLSDAAAFDASAIGTAAVTALGDSATMYPRPRRRTRHHLGFGEARDFGCRPALGL
jgi:hypothetical protein